MKSFLIASLLCITGISFLPAQAPPLKTISYPSTRKCDQKDNYFGREIADPYRWLEDDRSAETAAWVKAENKVTCDYLSHIPFRERIRKRLTAIWSFEKNGAPFKKGNYYFSYRNTGTQNQSVLYISEKPGSTARILLDPNSFSSDGTVALSGTGISRDGKYLAYATSKAGSDWEDMHVMEIKTGKTLTDHLAWIKFSGISWKGDGFYYSRFDTPAKGTEFSAKNVNHKVYFHKAGTLQNKDVLIYEDKTHPDWNFSAQVSDDESLLYISVTESTSGNFLLVKDLSKEDSPFVKLTQGFEYNYSVVDNNSRNILLVTNNHAPSFRLISVSMDKPGAEDWKEIISEQKDLLESVSLAGNFLIVKYLKDVTSKLFVFTPEGKQLREIRPGDLGMINDVNGDKKDSLLFFNYTTFTTPSMVYVYNLNKDLLSVYSKPKIDFRSDDFETRQVFYTSKDGTKIPMFITCKKGLKLDGNNPAFLFGYGGFDISYTPEFRIDRAVFIENGGVYAVANLRGGGEYGEDWHHAGTLCNKQHVFDDFIAAADYLVEQKYTSHARLAIHGRSNGGLLIGAVMTQRPDLAKVALPTVGVFDMLR